MNYTWEQLTELFGDLTVYEERDDDRDYEVAQNWVEFYILRTRLFCKPKNVWVECQLEYSIYVEPTIHIKRFPIGLYKDGELKINYRDVIDIKIHNRLPDEVVEILLK